MNKVVITGGTRGIGRALADALIAEGCEVMVCGRSHDTVRAVREQLGVRAIACDVGTPSGAERLASAVRSELCGVDILINNAGVQHAQDIVAGLDTELAVAEVTVNLLGPIAVTNALLPLLMASRCAAIVNVTSALAIAPSPRSPIYSAAKGGLATWTHGLRAQLSDTGVRVIEVVPPLVATDMTAGRHAGAVPPERVAQAIVVGLRRRRERIVIGKARALSAIHRVSPALARRVMRGR